MNIDVSNRSSCLTPKFSYSERPLSSHNRSYININTPVNNNPKNGWKHRQKKIMQSIHKKVNKISAF